MAYSESARQLRRCSGTRRDGTPCQAYATWGDPHGRCAGHGGRNAGPPTPCTCGAYAWPHRPGGGLCRWPDAPAATCPTTTGTHSPLRRPDLPRIPFVREAIAAGGYTFGRPAMLNNGRRPRRFVVTTSTKTYAGSGRAAP